MITNDPSTWPSGDPVWTVCQAIALAEGANVAGAAPDRYNNPGDLSKGDEHGQAVFGYTVLPDGENLIMFATKNDGWNALYQKIANILAGASSVYQPSMTWTQIGQVYAPGSGSWAQNVAGQLGVSPDSAFADYFSGTSFSASGGSSSGPASSGLP